MTEEVKGINLATSTLKEMVEWYNNHVEESEQVKKFKDKDTAQKLCGALMAKLVGTSDEDMEEEVEEVKEENATSILSQLTSANNGLGKTNTKNEGVGKNVMMLLEEGLSNKEILAKIHEMYGNANTSYACVAWYRNKWSKSASKREETEAKFQNFMKKYGVPAEALEELKSL